MTAKQPNSRHCFVCGLENPFGLRIHFYETAPDEVTAHFTAPEHYQGYPGILHGGITAAILDEAAGRAFMGTDPATSTFMYTAELRIKYRHKIPIGQPLRIVGKRVRRKRRLAEAFAAIYDSQGQLLAEATALLVDLPQQPAPEERERLGWRVYPE